MNLEAFDLFQSPPADDSIRPVVPQFRIDTHSFRISPQRPMLPEDRIRVAKEEARTRTLGRRMIFSIGSLTREINTIIGKMSEEKINFKKSLFQGFRERGIDCPNCWERQEWGSFDITDYDATEIDGLLIANADVIAPMPDAYKSPNAWEEAKYAVALEKSFIVISLGSEQEAEYWSRLKQLVKDSNSCSRLARIEFTTVENFLKQIDLVWPRLTEKPPQKVRLNPSWTQADRVQEQWQWR